MGVRFSKNFAFMTGMVSCALKVSRMSEDVIIVLMISLRGGYNF